MKFYKIIFETWFSRLTLFTRKLRYDIYANFRNDFRDIITACGLHGSQFWAIHGGYHIITGYRWITTWLLCKDRLLYPTGYWRVTDFWLVHPTRCWRVVDFWLVHPTRFWLMHPTGCWRIANLWLVHPTGYWRITNFWLVHPTGY